MLVVAGLSLKNLHPRVWDPSAPFHLPALSAVMVSYAEFHLMAARRKAAMQKGLRAYLGVPEGIKIYLDNGAFFFGSQPGSAPLDEYEEFVESAEPDWKPIPQDYIPFPSMSPQARRACFDKTMRINLQYQHNGYVPVVHIGSHLPQYVASMNADKRLSKKRRVALGGIVPNLLRKPKAIPYSEVLAGLSHVRDEFPGKSIHVFGVGGTATIHLTALCRFDSVDSSGWRNRAARGIIQLPGSGERLVADLGNWRGRTPSAAEWKKLRQCPCPACAAHGIQGLKASKLHGFCCRATHNLWVLLEENRWLQEHIPAGTYAEEYASRLDNSIYRPIIDELLEMLGVPRAEASHRQKGSGRGARPAKGSSRQSLE
jgi:7-cyano-7-deazaguanine tRNA-ribosyltransferase